MGSLKPHTQLTIAVAIASVLLAGVGIYFWRDPHAFHTGQSASGDVAGNPDTDWLHDAHYGVLMHFLPSDAKSMALVNRFDVDAVATQLESIGAKYLVFTLGQYSGFYNAPNSVLNTTVGYAPGERCAIRDLPLDLHRALQPKGIKLMLYLTCQVGHGDPRAQAAFGLSQGHQEQPLNARAADKWAAVIQAWSDRYGDKIAGWWFDGAYPHLGFDDLMASAYAEAAKHGNSKSIVGFSTTLGPNTALQAADFTAGETENPFAEMPTSRWVDATQWHVLTYLATRWGGRDTRFPTVQWAGWAAKVIAKGGVITFDLGPNYDPNTGPIGVLSEVQMEQVKAIGAALRSR